MSQAQMNQAQQMNLPVPPVRNSDSVENDTPKQETIVNSSENKTRKQYKRSFTICKRVSNCFAEAMKYLGTPYVQVERHRTDLIVLVLLNMCLLKVGISLPV